MKKGKGTLFVFTGPSGVGKGTLKQLLLEEFSDRIAYSVSATTRKPRPGEKDGVDYWFVSREEFLSRIERGEFLEYAQFAGNYYGTPAFAVQQQLELGHDVLLEIEVQGAAQIRSRVPEAVFIFVLPPSLEELEKRLTLRNTEPPEVVRRRLAVAAGEIAQASLFTYNIVNDTLESAYAQLRRVYLEHSGACAADRT